MKIPAVIGVASKCQPFSPENRGNFLHSMAARRIIGNHREYPTVQTWTAEQIETLESECSHIVLIMANALRLGIKESPYRWYEIAADNILRTKLPTVVFGLGAQASLSGELEYIVSPSLLRLLKIIEERSKAIAVRGAFSADALSKLGIKNAVPLGCQSCFWHGARFPFGLDRPLEIPDVCFNYTNALSERDLLSMGVQNGFTLIGQGELYEEHASAEQEFEKRRIAPLFKKIPEAAYRDFCRTKFHQFTNVVDWMNFISRFSFSFGTRFHGNMVALQSGVRSLWIVHDLRTKELCDHMSLPYINLDKAIQTSSVQKLAEDADYSSFFRRYPELYEKFLRYVKDAGLRSEKDQPAVN